MCCNPKHYPTKGWILSDGSHKVAIGSQIHATIPAPNDYLVTACIALLFKPSRKLDTDKQLELRVASNFRIRHWRKLKNLKNGWEPVPIPGLRPDSDNSNMLELYAPNPTVLDFINALYEFNAAKAPTMSYEEWEATILRKNTSGSWTR